LRKVSFQFGILQLFGLDNNVGLADRACSNK